MLNQFSRTELLLGHDNMEKLNNARGKKRRRHTGSD